MIVIVSSESSFRGIAVTFNGNSAGGFGTAGSIAAIVSARCFCISSATPSHPAGLVDAAMIIDGGESVLIRATANAEIDVKRTKFNDKN